VVVAEEQSGSFAGPTPKGERREIVARAPLPIEGSVELEMPIEELWEAFLDTLRRPTLTWRLSQATSARPTLSATQQGLSEPSTSTVKRVTTCHQPPPTSSTEAIWAFARTRLPAGTGAGKRTLFQP
jgi:hypothetical protein